MRKTLSMLLAIGIASIIFVGCGTSTQETTNNKGDSSITSNESSSNEGNKDTNKSDDNSDKGKEENSDLNKDKIDKNNEGSKAQESQNKEESNKMSNEQGKEVDKENLQSGQNVTVKNGVIKIPSNLKMLQIDLNYNGGDPLKVKEVTDYNSALNDMLYGVIIGKNPTKVGDINGEWEYNTLVTKFDTIKYPNFFEVQKSEWPNLEFGITLKSKDKQMEFSLGSYMNNSGHDAKEEFESLIKNFGENGKIIDKHQEGNTFSFTVEKDGFMEYHYGFISRKGDDVNSFFYKYPVKYKDEFKKIIEDSKESFVPTKEFPREN